MEFGNRSKSMKKTLTTKELFCGIPRLREYFYEMDRAIKAFEKKDEKGEIVKELKEKRKELLKTVKEMNRTDLQLLYYVHHLDKMYPHHFLHALKKLFVSQEELKNLVKGTKNSTDLFEQENS